MSLKATGPGSYVDARTVFLVRLDPVVVEFANSQDGYDPDDAMLLAYTQFTTERPQVAGKLFPAGSFALRTGATLQARLLSQTEGQVHGTPPGMLLDQASRIKVGDADFAALGEVTSFQRSAGASPRPIGPIPAYARGVAITLYLEWYAVDKVEIVALPATWLRHQVREYETAWNSPTLLEAFVNGRRYGKKSAYNGAGILLNAQRRFQDLGRDMPASFHAAVDAGKLVPTSEVEL